MRISCFTLGGTTSGTFSGNLAGNATTATSLSGAINGSQITNGTVTSAKLGSNLALGGTTTGSFSGSFTGDLNGTASDVAEINSPTLRISVANTPTLGDVAGFDFNAGKDGLFIETAEPSESAGIFLNGNVAVIYCPGDVDLLQGGTKTA